MIISPENGKGCDIGYAPAASSCERANCVDARTVAALDASTAFAVPRPQLLLAETVGFFGSGCPFRSPCRADDPAHFELPSSIPLILSAVDAVQTKYSLDSYQCDLGQIYLAKQNSYFESRTPIRQRPNSKVTNI